MAAAFFETADELVLSTICTHLDVRSLRAIAQALHAFRQLAAQELPGKVVAMLAGAKPDSTAAIRMLGRAERFDLKSAAKHAPVMLKFFLENSQSEPEVCAAWHRARAQRQSLPYGAWRTFGRTFETPFQPSSRRSGPD
jgi:hypothetical protein